MLCPVDFSEHSRLALRYAAAIAARGKGRLTVAHANDPLLVAAAAIALHDRHLSDRSMTELRAFADATLTVRNRKRLRLTCRVSVGDPPDQITKTATRVGADLIVMGTHGLTGAGRVLIGSTTLDVLRRTAIPIVAVPRCRETSTTSVSSSWPGARIVAAVELDDTSPKYVAMAARIAQWFGSGLLLVHVVRDVGAPGWLAHDVSAHDRIRVARAQREVDALSAIAGRHVHAAGRVVCGQPADEIAAVALTEQAGLVVTALRDRRGWFGARRGSVSYHVLSHAVTPVLACPSRWRPR